MPTISPYDRQLLTKYKESQEHKTIIASGWKHERDCMCGGMLQTWYSKNGLIAKHYLKKGLMSIPDLTNKRVKTIESKLIMEVFGAQATA